VTTHDDELTNAIESLRDIHETSPNSSVDEGWFSIEPVSGGHSGNAVYRLRIEERRFCAKVFEGGSSIADREWNTLHALNASKVACTPSALNRSSGSSEILVMSWADGHPLGYAALIPEQIEKIAEALMEFSRTAADSLPVGTNHPNTLQQRMFSQWRPRVLEMQAPDAYLQHVCRKASQWFETAECASLFEPTSEWFGRGDPNLANILWDSRERSVTFVDFEHAGVNDRCVELADMVEHLQSHACDDDVWEMLWALLDLDEEERRRVESARRFFASLWLAVLITDDLAKRINPPGRVFEQAKRVERLLL
jgi:aminoglycoside phosphotransferase